MFALLGFVLGSAFGIAMARLAMDGLLGGFLQEAACGVMNVDLEEDVDLSENSRA